MLAERDTSHADWFTAIVAILLALTTFAIGSVQFAPVVYADSDGGCNPQPGQYFHCYSNAEEYSEGNGYTGIREQRVVQNLNLSLSNWIFTTMWIGFPDGHFVELGTAYGNGGEWDYTFNCSSTFCNYIKFATTQQSAGEHNYKLNRETSDLTLYDALVDGSQWGPAMQANWTYSGGISTGLESYVQNAHFPTYASYGLKYKRWNGSFVDWSGRDDHTIIQSPMCGQWHLDTSWWAGEDDSCA